MSSTNLSVVVQCARGGEIARVSACSLVIQTGDRRRGAGLKRGSLLAGESGVSDAAKGPMKKCFSIMLDMAVFARLESVKARTGLSKSEQIRRAIEMWLESREWGAQPALEPHGPPPPGRVD
jgi:hypothetical protein